MSESNEPSTMQDLLLDPRMRSRLIRALRRAFHTGISLYLMSTALLVGMAWSLREAITQVMRNRAAISSEIDRHLRSHPDGGNHQPDEPEILSIIFDSIQPQEEQAETQEARRRAQGIERVFLAIAREMLATENTCCDEDPKTESRAELLFDKALPDTTSPEQRKQWKQTLVDSICEYREKRCPKRIMPCRPGTFASVPGDFSLGTPGCDRDEQWTRLLVPAAFNICSREPEPCTSTANGPTCAAPADTDCFPCGIQAAAAFSRPLDVVLQAFMQNSCDLSPWKTSLASVYFTTPEGLIRHWSCALTSAPPAVRHDGAPAHASYVQRLMRRDGMAEYETDVSLDPNGFGPVRTRCVRIEKPHPTAPRLMGVLCFDFTVPLEQILEPLTRSTIVTVEVAMVVMPDAGGDFQVPHYWTLADPELREPPEDMRTRLQESDEATRRAFSLELLETLGRLKAEGQDAPEALRDFNKNVITLAGTRTGARTRDGRFLLPGGWDEASQSRAMLVLRPAVSDLRGALLLMVLSGLLLVLWVVLLWRGNVLARRMSENELAVQLLRKLGVALMLLDEEGLVMAANDEAENVLCCFLPHLNTWRLRIDQGFRQERQPSDPTVRVSELIFPDVVLEKGMKRMAYEELWRHRLRGRPARFFARLRHADPRAACPKGDWVRVTAAPVVIKRRGRKTLTTSLSAFERVSRPEVVEQLNQLVRDPEGRK